MSVIAGLRILVKLKTRRLGQLEEAVKQRKAQLQAQLHTLEACREEEARCRAAEEERRARIAETAARCGFRGSEIVLLQQLAKEAAERTAAAATHVKQAQERAASAEEDLRSAERTRRRGEQQLERCRERLQAALDQAERALEDSQDEESEEAAVARLLAQARAAA